MFDDPHYFWKNFRLGTELQIAGSFIYNAIYTFDNMETFYFEEECFEFLYNISVGLERLEKIAVILIEHDNTQLQEDFEKSLITHNHLELLKRIKNNNNLNLGKSHTKFLGLLDEFYKTTRYDRYNLSSVYRPPQDQAKLIKFISEGLNIEIKVGLPFSTEITDNIKAFIGKVIGKLTTQIFEIVRFEANRVGMYTYEIAYNSKAFKIFTAEEFDFKKEKLMQREAFVYLIKKMPKDTFKKLLDTIEPLEFGQLNTNKYVQSIMNIHKDRQVADEMEYLYEENDIHKSRQDEIMVIGSDTNFDFFDDFDED